MDKTTDTEFQSSAKKNEIDLTITPGKSVQPTPISQVPPLLSKAEPQSVLTKEADSQSEIRNDEMTAEQAETGKVPFVKNCGLAIVFIGIFSYFAYLSYLMMTYSEKLQSLGLGCLVISAICLMLDIYLILTTLKPILVKNKAVQADSQVKFAESE